MIRICIGGMTASGKTALGQMLAKELNVMHITKHDVDTFHKATEEARRSRESHLGVIQATSTKKYAKQFDDEFVSMASKNNCVVTTWLGPWLVKDATLRVWLNAPIEERVKRRARDWKLKLREAKRLIDEKDRQNIKTFKKIQGIDIEDHSIFDMELNTGRLSLNQMVSLISMLALTKERKPFA